MPGKDELLQIGHGSAASDLRVLQLALEFLDVLLVLPTRSAHHLIRLQILAPRVGQSLITLLLSLSQ